MILLPLPGYGRGHFLHENILMLKKNFITDEPIIVTVGNVKFQILRIGERSLSLGVDAPRDQRITFGDQQDASPHGSCERATDCDTP